MLTVVVVVVVVQYFKCIENISVKQHCPPPLPVCTMCMCVCGGGGGGECILNIVTLEPLLMSTFGVSLLLF